MDTGSEEERQERVKIKDCIGNAKYAERNSVAKWLSGTVPELKAAALT